MAENFIKDKVYIDFEIINNSEPDKLIEEFKMIIGLNKVIIVWSKTETLLDMFVYSRDNGLEDYIWDYKLKDSFYYGSVDFLIDNDQRLVDMFVRNGVKANCITKVV